MTLLTISTGLLLL